MSDASAIARAAHEKGAVEAKAHATSSRAIMRRLENVSCPVCGATHEEDRETFLRFDRYLLPVHFALCVKCGLVYTAKNLSGELLAQFYRDHYRRYYENVRVVSNAYLYETRDKLKAAYRWIEIRAVAPNITSVLEIGSGLGFFLARCRREGVETLLGFEPGAVFAEFSRTTLGLGEHIRQGMFNETPDIGFRPDLVAMFHVFEHLEDPAGALRWVRSQCHPETILVIEVPNFGGDWARLGLDFFHIAHRTYWTERTLSGLLRPA